MRTIPLAVMCIVFSFIGCHSPHLVPNLLPSPALEQQGDIQLSGSAGTNSYDAQLAVSPVSHLIIGGSGSWSFGKKQETSHGEAEETHSHRIYEILAGYYFYPFKLHSNNFKIELLSGYGFGTVKGSTPSGTYDILGFPNAIYNVDANYRQYFAQCNALISASLESTGDSKAEGSALEYGSLIRLSKTILSDYKKNGTSLGFPNSETNFLQLAALGRVGTRLGVQAQTGWLFIISEPSYKLSYSSFYIAAGLYLRL